MIQSQSAAAAKDYFNTALARSDYYIDGQELTGTFHGKLAERLGLTHDVNKDTFHRLCDNKHPFLERNLTPRSRDDRTVGYDINFHAPKSVSVLHALHNDSRILDAFKESVRGTMKDIENDMKTRVRLNNVYDDREVGNLLWTEFIHQTARPVGNNPPDPHLHAHCYAFNIIHDPVEGRYKAGQFRDIKRDMPYYQAIFHKRLADRLAGCGYTSHKNDLSFDLDTLPKKTIDVFSKRTDQIGRVAKEKNITSKKLLDKLGAQTRAKKQKGQTMGELKERWLAELGESPVILAKDEIEKPQVTKKDCMDYAIDHGFAHVSVINDRRLLAHAVHHAIDRPDITLESLKQEFEADKRLIRVPDRFSDRLCTTHEILSEEKKMVFLGVQGRGQCRSFSAFVPKDQEPEPPKTFLLNEGQQKALDHIMKSPDRIMIIEGGAGTGKTTLIKSADQEIRKGGFDVFYFAPTAGASRDVLRSEGFENAETFQKLKNSKELQEQIKGQVVWLDEAGLMSTKDMHSLFELVHEKNARLILSGDTRQHGSVSRGDALRILKTIGKLPSPRLRKIMRQKPQEYRKAVDEISRGQIHKGFKRLDSIEAIRELKPETASDYLAFEYLGYHRYGKSALVISPTNDQAEQVTDKIRATLKQRNIIGKRDKKCTRLANLYFTEAQKKQRNQYREGQIIQFHQNVKGHRKSDQCRISQITEKDVMVMDKKGVEKPLPLERPHHFDVYKEVDLDLVKGDRIRITKNIHDMEGHRIDNGNILQIKKFDAKGNVIAVAEKRGSSKKSREYILPGKLGNYTHAYCMTSYASQGKTVDHVLIYQPAGTFPATNEKQFYVSVSRGRQGVTIFTDKKKELLDHASKIGDRLSALELVNEKKQMEFEMIRNQEVEKTIKISETRKDWEKNRSDIDYGII